MEDAKRLRDLHDLAGTITDRLDVFARRMNATARGSGRVAPDLPQEICDAANRLPDDPEFAGFAFHLAEAATNALLQIREGVEWWDTRTEPGRMYDEAVEALLDIQTAAGEAVRLAVLHGVEQGARNFVGWLRSRLLTLPPLAVRMNTYESARERKAA